MKREREDDCRSATTVSRLLTADCEIESIETKEEEIDNSQPKAHPVGGEDVDHAEFLLHLAEIQDLYGEAAKKTVEALQCSADEQKIASSYAQRSKEWFRVREKRLTASNFGAAANHNPYCKSKKLLGRLLDKKKKFKGNRATRFGTDNEPVAVEVYRRYLEKTEPGSKLSFPNFIISRRRPYLGASPDGLVLKSDGSLRGLEIKCPFGRKLYPVIPLYYYDQIQMTMWITGWKEYDFIVWTSRHSQLRRFDYDTQYVETLLLPRLTNFYFATYVPQLLATNHRLQQHAEVSSNEPVKVIEIEIEIDIEQKEKAFLEALVQSAADGHPSAADEPQVQTTTGNRQQSCATSVKGIDISLII